MIERGVSVMCVFVYAYDLCFWLCRIIVDLLKMNVAPLAVYQTLKTMCAGQKVSETSAGDASTASHTTTAPTESRGE